MKARFIHPQGLTIFLMRKRVRELVAEKGLRKVAGDLDIDPASLYRSLRDGSNVKLDRIQKLLDYLGYGLKIFKKKGGNKYPRPVAFKGRQRRR